MENKTDCCFCAGKDWFRYRVGAIIVSEGYALFSHGQNCGYYYTVGGDSEKMRWLPIDRLDEYDIRPAVVKKLIRDLPTEFKAIPHNYSRTIAQSDFSSDCTN